MYRRRRTYLPPSNANGFTVFKLDVFRCGCGIVTRGDDCNASTVVHAQILLFDKSDKEVGVAERGFLGNHYYSCSVDACKGPAYLVTSGVNFGGLHGCYSEGGTGPIHIASPSFTVFGGDYGSRFTRESQGWVIENRLSIPPFWVVNEQGPKRAETYVGYDGDSNAVFGWSSAFDPHYWLLRYYDDEKVWSTEWANSRLFRANYLTGSDEHPRGGGMQGFSHFLLGVANNIFQPKLPIKVSADTQKPPPNHNAIVKASEQPKWALYKKGDIVFNADPKPGDATDSNHQYIGWVCIDDTDDNNQIWKGFGKIES